MCGISTLLIRESFGTSPRSRDHAWGTRGPDAGRIWGPGEHLRGEKEASLRPRDCGNEIEGEKGSLEGREGKGERREKKEWVKGWDGRWRGWGRRKGGRG